MNKISMRAWPRTTAAAVARQEALRHRVVCEDRHGPITTVAGVDVGYLDGGRVAHAAAALLRFPDLEVIEYAQASEKVRFPYVPGLLSFRETPVAVRALSRLSLWPSLILCDAHGYAHPRRFGLACHLGVLTDTPTIGVGKTRLIGSFGSLGQAKGSVCPLVDGDEQIGTVLRTRQGVRPIFVSVGHRLSLASAVAFTLACVTRYRLPETTRRADHLASLR